MIELKAFEFNMLPVNTYVVWDGTKEAAIIDPGCYYPGEGDELCSFIRENGLTPKLLLNTHLHFDHVFGNPVIEREFGIRAMGNEADQDWIITLPKKLAAFGMQFDTKVEPILPENFLNEGDSVSFGDTTFEIFHVPGHSPGSLVYYERVSGTLFTGDVLFRCGIGRGDFPDGDTATLIDGINGKLMKLPDDTRVLPGHGPDTTIGYERLHNPYI